MKPTARAVTRLSTPLIAATLALLLASGEPLAAQSYPGAGPAATGHSTHAFGADDPVRYLVSPHRLNELALDPHQVRDVRRVAHSFVDRHGHRVREFEHLSHRERAHLRRARHAHRRAILVDVLDPHQTERFTHLYRSRSASDRYGHDGLHLGASSRHGIRPGAGHRGARHPGARHRGGHGARHDRHGVGHRGFGVGRRSSRHGRSAGPGHLLGRVLGLGLSVGLHRGAHGNRHSRFGHRSRFHRGLGHGAHGHGGHGHGRGHHPR